jgi:hypothetical protein
MPVALYGHRGIVMTDATDTALVCGGGALNQSESDISVSDGC